ncbi:MAG TPA: hypothetical protein VGE21_02425 [Flavobacteriales bacterium]
MKSIDRKQLLPVVAALALFYVLCLGYFSPVFEGKQLAQHDIQQWKGMAQEVTEHRDLTGEEALWTGSMFSGMPAYQVAVQWTGNLLSYVDGLFHGFLPRPANFLFLYLLGMFVLLRILKVDPWLSIVGAIAFAFSSYFFVILPAGHTSKANAIGYMPLVFGALYLLYRGRMWVGAALLALFLGLEVMMNHVQVTYYLGFLLLLFVLAELVRAVRERTLTDFAKRSGLGGVAVALALLCNIGLLWSTVEYGKYSTRGKSELTVKADGTPASAMGTGGLERDYVTQYSYGKQESFTLLVPDAKGGSTRAMGDDPAVNAHADARFRSNLAQMNRYWGDQLSTSGPQYAGAIVVLLMLLMLFQAEGRGRWWLLGSLGLLLVLIAISNAAPFSEEEGVVMGMNAGLLSGLVLIAYLVAGLFLMRDGLTYALFSALLVTLLLSWGRNLMPLTDFFLDHVPGYNKFRAVTIILVVVELAAPVLGILYLDRLVKEGGWSKPVEKRSLIAMGALLVVLLAMAVVPEGLFNFLSDQEREALNRQAEDPKMEAQVVAFVDALKSVRVGLFTADVWRSLLFVAAAGALIFLFGRRKLGRPVLIAGVGALVLLDQAAVDKRYLNNEKERGRYVQWVDQDQYDHPYRPDAADRSILQSEWNPAAQSDHEAVLAARKSDGPVKAEDELLLRFGSLRRNANYRVLDLGNPFSDAKPSYFHRSIGGYHGAKLKRYQELIEFHIAPEVQAVAGLLRSGPSITAIDSLLARQGVLNMLNTKYIVYSGERPPLRNAHALGAGWFVDEVRWAKDADAEIATLGTIDPRRTAVVDERYRTQVGNVAPRADSTATVELVDYATDRLTYKVRSANGGVVVFSEIWYGPDWKAAIDDAPAEHFRADYVLRGLSVPAGEHMVTFHIESRPFHSSRPVALASSALVLLVVLAALGMELRGARKPE